MKNGHLPSIMPEELKPQAWKNPLTLGSSPMMGLWSGVKDSGPQTVLLIPDYGRG